MGKRKTLNLKQDIINAALTLFSDIGYDQTSIKAITQELGVSKGAFYHYFESKEDILECIAEDYVNESLSIIESVANDQEASAVDKLNKIIGQLMTYKTEAKEIRLKVISMYEKGGNLKLKQKIIDFTLSKAKAPYAKIFQQGKAEGSFDNEFYDEVAKLWVNIIIIMNSAIAMLVREAYNADFNQTALKIKRKVDFYQDALERLIGLEKGSFQLSKQITENLAAAYSL